jgi:hypothetical protein
VVDYFATARGIAGVNNTTAYLKWLFDVIVLGPSVRMSHLYSTAYSTFLFP